MDTPFPGAAAPPTAQQLTPLPAGARGPGQAGTHGTGRVSSSTRRRPPWCTAGRRRPRRSRSTHSPRQCRRSTSLGRRPRRRAWGPPGEGPPCAGVHTALPGPDPPLWPEKLRTPRRGPQGAAGGRPATVLTTPAPTDHCSRPLPAAEGCLGGLCPVSLPGRYGRAWGSSHVSQRKYWASGHVSKGHTGRSGGATLQGQRLARGPAHRPTRPRPSHLAVAPPTPVAPPTLLWLCPQPRPAHLAVAPPTLVAPPTPTPRPPCCGRAGKRGF